MASNLKPGKGGKRAGAGRKPGAFTVLKRQIEAQGVAEAEYAFSLYVSVMRNAECELDMRMAAAKEVMDRVLGKPKQVSEVAGKNGGPIQVQEIEKAVERIYGEKQ